MNYSPKIAKPINLRISKQCYELMADEEHDETYDLKKGVMLGGEHFGFIIIGDTSAGQKEAIYPTQCRVTAVEVDKENVLKIYEEGKYFPWKFGLNGTKIEHATFNELSKRDLQYLADNFDIHSKEQIPKVNSYRRR